MIGKVIKTKDGKAGSFFGLNRYILSGKEKIEYTNCFNTLVDDPRLCAVEMTCVAGQSRATKPVFHALISWRESEHPTPAQCDEAAKIVLQELGLEGHQAVIALHKNTDNYHLHISINKVDPETFKSIDANKGYTEKALERAARWIEYRQNWSVEENTWSVVTTDGQIIKNPDFKKKKEDKRIEQKVVDKENRYAEKSAVRIGQEQVKELIINAKSWEELHESLATVDCRYERKGSGAVVWIGDTAVKASAIAKACGLNKLEKTLGAFVEAPELQGKEQQNQQHKSEPLADYAEAANKQPEKLTNWQQYLQAKNKYYKERSAKRAKLKSEQNQRYKELKSTQAAERKELASRGWRGKGKQYNAERSMLALDHAVELSQLVEQHKRERRELSKSFGTRFQSFEEWNKSLGRNKEAQEWRFRRPRINEITKEDNLFVKPQPLADIRAFDPKADNRTGFVAYIDKVTQRTAFVDKGKSIRVNDINDKAILASLQLGAAKWGRVKISGTQEYIDKCIKIAVEHNIKISNPELQEQIETSRAERKAEFEKTRQVKTFKAGTLDEQVRSSAFEQPKTEEKEQPKAVVNGNIAVDVSYDNLHRDNSKISETTKKDDIVVEKDKYAAKKAEKEPQETITEDIKATAIKTVTGVKEFAGNIADRFKEYREQKAKEKAQHEWYEANKDVDEHGYYVEILHNPNVKPEQRAVWISGEEHKKVVDAPSQEITQGDKLIKGEDGMLHYKMYCRSLKAAEAEVNRQKAFIDSRDGWQFVAPPKDKPRLIYPVVIEQKRKSLSRYGYNPCDIPEEQDFEVSAGKPRMIDRFYTHLIPTTEETERRTEIYAMNKHDCDNTVKEYQNDTEKCRERFKGYPFKMTAYEENCYNKANIKDFNKVITPLEHAGSINGLITVCKDNKTGDLFGIKKSYGNGSGSVWIKDYLLPDKVFDRILQDVEEKTIKPGNIIVVDKIIVDEKTKQITINYGKPNNNDIQDKEMRLKPEVVAREERRIEREKQLAEIAKQSKGPKLR